MRTRNVLLILFTIILIAFIGGGFFFLRSAYLLNKVRVVLENQLEKQLKHPVTIGHLSGHLLTGLDIKQFEIADAQPGKPPPISIDEIKVRYKLLGLLRGKFLVTQLDFKTPRINASMDADGVLNLTKLVPESKPESKAKLPFQPFISHINLEKGEVRFDDEKRNLKIAISGIHSRIDGPLGQWKHTGNLEVQDGRFELNGVEKKIDTLQTQFALVENEGELKEMRLTLGNSSLVIAGRLSPLNSKSPPIEAQLNLDLDFGDLQKFLPPQYQVEGVVQVNINARGTPSEITGQVGLTLPFAKLNQLRLENLVAKAEFTQNSFHVTEVEGTLASGKLTGEAEINLIPPPPQAGAPEEQGARRSPDSPDAAKQVLTYHGWLQIAALQAKQLLPMINVPENLLVATGDLNGKIQFSGSSSAPRDLKLDSALQLANATLNNVPVRTSDVHGKIEADELSLTANLDEARIQLNGTLGFAGQRNLELNITKIDVGKLVQILHLPADLAGDGTLTGKISSEIPLSASFSIPDASLNKVPIGNLTGDFHFADGRVFLHPVRLSKGQSQLTLDGVARIEGDIPLDFKVRVQPLQIADYVKLAGADYPIEGVATGDLVLDGTSKQLNGRGTIQIAKGKAWGLALDALTLPLKIENYVVNIPNFELSARGQRSILNAQISPNQDYTINFQSEPMRLGELALAFGMTNLPLDANLVVKVTGKGHTSDPRVDMSVDFSNVTYAGKPWQDARLTGAYRNNTLQIEGMGFDNTFQIQGGLKTTPGNPYQFSVRSTGFDLTPFLQIATNSTRDDLAGTVDGTLEIAGTLEEPSKLTLDMVLSTLSLHINGQQVLNPAPIELHFANNLLRLQSFELADARGGHPFLRASGTARIPLGAVAPDKKVDNPIDFVVESEGFVLEHLTDVLGLPPTLSGVVHYKLTGNGTAENPRFTLDWALPALRIKTPPEPITVSEGEGHLAYQDGNLTIEQFNFNVLGNPVQIQGSIPIDLSLTPMPLEKRIAADTMHVTLASNIQMAQLDKLVPQLSQIQGCLNLTAQLTGNPLQPVLTAAVGVTGGQMQMLDFPHPIENLKVDLQVRGGEKTLSDLLTIDLKSAEWQLGGARYRAVGNWRLSKTQAQSSLISIFMPPPPGGGMKDVPLGPPRGRGGVNEPISFQLQLEGKGVNLTDLANYLITQETIAGHKTLVEGQVDVSLKLQGNGYQPEQMSATLKCNDLYLTVNKHDVRNMEQIRFHFAGRKLNIESFQVGQSVAWFSTAGTIDMDGNMDIHFTLDQIPFSVLFAEVTLPLLNQALWLKGTLASNITVRGNFANPVITADWVAQSQGVGDSDFDRLNPTEITDTGQIIYQDRTFEIRDARLTGYGNQLSISGRIPIDLSFQPLKLTDRFLDLPIDLRIRGREITLGFLTSISPVIKESGGTADVDLRIQGTTASPYLQGFFSIRDGSMKLINFDVPISDGKLELTANKGEINISPRFQIGDGKYEADIGLRLDGLFPTDFEVRRFTLRNAQISDFARNFLKGEIASNLKGYVTAEANVKFPINRFILPGETVWTPKIAPVTPSDLLKYVTSELKIQNVLVNVLVENLEYSIRNPKPIEILLKEQRLSLEEGFILEDQNIREGTPPSTGGPKDYTFSPPPGGGGKAAVPSTVADQRLRLTGFGSWELGKKLLFRINMQHFNLGFLSDFVPDAYPIRGFLNASLDIRGTDAQPEITVAWDTPKLSINQAEVDTFTGTIVYKDQQLRIGEKRNPVQLSIGANRAVASGLIPFALSLSDFKAEPLPQDIEGGFDVEIKDLDFLPLIVPQFGVAKATGGINITIGGLLSSPQLRGVANLRNFAFDIPDSYIRVDNARVALDFTQDGLNIRDIRGQLNDGTFQINGSLQSKWLDVSSINLSTSLRDGCTFKQPGVYQIKIRDADFSMIGQVVTNGIVKLPPLSGSIYIEKGQYEQDWHELVKQWVDKTSDVQFEVLSDYPVVRDLQLDLNVVAPNLQVVSNLGKIDINASVNGKIVGPIQKPIFSGRVDLSKGEISTVGLNYPFSIKSGYIVNSSQLEFNPRYDISAETAEPIRNVEIHTTDGQVRTKDLKVTAHFRGSLNEATQTELQAEVLRKQPGEEYQLTDSQIISILTVGSANPATDGTSSTSGTVPTDFILRQTNRVLGGQVSKWTGSDVRFDISPDSFERSKFLFTKELSERLSLTYSSTFQLHAEPRIGVEYQINERISITGERNEQGKYGIDLQLEHKF